MHWYMIILKKKKKNDLNSKYRHAYEQLLLEKILVIIHT